MTSNQMIMLFVWFLAAVGVAFIIFVITNIIKKAFELLTSIVGFIALCAMAIYVAHLFGMI